jgi:DUF4097 and DUF4098 domain-containing protein YvlB
MDRVRTLCAIAAAFVIFSSAAVSAEEISRDFTRSFEVGRGYTLRLRHGDGDVRITPWDKDEVEIEVHYRAERKGLGDDDFDFKVEFEEKNGVIEVTGRENRSSFIGLHIFIIKEYTYEIFAPSYIELDVQGEDGKVDIDRWLGDMEIRLEDGELNLYECRPAKTRIRSEDGEITLDGHSGALDIIAEDADLNINRCRLTECRIQLDDGDTRIRDSEGDFYLEVQDGDSELLNIQTHIMDLKSEDGLFDVELLKTDMLELEIRTDDGDVRVGLQKGISATFSIDVDDGRIRTDLPSAGEVQEGRHWRAGKLGNGRGKIRIRTVDGSVTLREIR